MWTPLPPPGASDLAFKWLDVRVHDHMGLQRLLLHEALEAQVTLVRPDVGVDQHMSLHVGQQGELPPTDATFVLLYALQGGKGQETVVNGCRLFLDSINTFRFSMMNAGLQILWHGIFLIPPPLFLKGHPAKGAAGCQSIISFFWEISVRKTNGEKQNASILWLFSRPV